MKSKTHIAKGRCTNCQDIIISKHGGDFVSCKCGKSFIDQERWGGLYIRMGGKCELIERSCPEGCEYLHL